MSAPPGRPQSLTDAIQRISLRLGSGSPLPTDWVGPLLHLLAAATESDVESALEKMPAAKVDILDWKLHILCKIMRWALDDVFLSFCRHGHEQAQDLEPLLGPALRVLTRAIVNRVGANGSKVCELQAAFQSELYDTIDWNVQSIVGLEGASFAASLGPTMLPILTEFHFHLVREFSAMRPIFYNRMVQRFQMVTFPTDLLVKSVVEQSELLDVSRLSTCVFMSFLLVLFSCLDCSDTVETLHIVYPLQGLTSATFLSWLGTYLDCLLDPSSLPSISRIYRRVSQNLLSLLHATAMMALDPSTPYWFHASDDQSPAARRRFASSVGSLVTSWLRRAQADPSLSAQFFAIDARITSESDMFYTSLCEGLAEYVVYDLLDGAEVAALIDAELLFMPLLLTQDYSTTSAFWRCSLSKMDRMSLVIATAFVHTKDRAAFVRQNEDVIISTLLRLAAVSSDSSQRLHVIVWGGFAFRSAMAFAPHMSAAGIKRVRESLKKHGMPFTLAAHLMLSLNGSLYHMKRTPADLLANPVYSVIFVATEVGNLLQGLYLDPLYSGLLRPDQFANVSRVQSIVEADHGLRSVIQNAKASNKGTYIRVSSLKYGAMVALVSRLLRLLKRYPEAFCGLTVQSNLATFVLYFGRFLREAEGEGLEQLEKSRKRLLQLSLDVRKAGSDRARARKAMEEKERCGIDVAAADGAVNIVHLARRLLHRVGQQLRAAVAARLELEAGT